MNKPTITAYSVIHVDAPALTRTIENLCTIFQQTGHDIYIDICKDFLKIIHAGEDARPKALEYMLKTHMENFKLRNPFDPPHVTHILHLSHACTITDDRVYFPTMDIRICLMESGDSMIDVIFPNPSYENYLVLSYFPQSGEISYTIQYTSSIQEFYDTHIDKITPA